MSERDNFDAAVKRMGSPPMGNVVLCLQPGLGRTGLYFDTRGKKGALPVEEAITAREGARNRARQIQSRRS
jgi:hypothetical protein